MWVIELTLHWYKSYSETLTNKCFELNPYDICVKNRLVMVKMYPCVVCGQQQRVTYGNGSSKGFNVSKNNFGELVVTRGKKNTFLGMNIKITEEKKVEIYTK